MDERDQRGGRGSGDDGDGRGGGSGREAGAVTSLLPYDRWTEQALRGVVVRALRHIATAGLPGEHHFYISFRTDAPGVVIPPHLRAQYPQEMTIVLQHQFWDLKVDDDRFSVGLSFGGVASTLMVPLDAVVGFADPHVQYGLRFGAVTTAAEAVADAPAVEAPDAEPGAEGAPQVVSLDAFRRKKD